ncbi:MAG: orotidine-5'-phosphate decarboxylase [Actinomycetota bacterium]
MTPEERLIIAIDESDIVRIMNLAETLRGFANIFKIGLTAFDALGPSVVAAFNKLGANVFLDLKLFDIPAQVSGATKTLTDLDVKMLTVHALGGERMMATAKKASSEAADKRGRKAPLVLAVTVPTSLDGRWLASLGIDDLEGSVRSLADAARSAGLDGVVASAREVALIRRDQGDEFIIVVPGIRLPGEKVQDQKRVATPEEALAAGADYLVVGRPITNADDPAAAAAEILRRMR